MRQRYRLTIATALQATSAERADVRNGWDSADRRRDALAVTD